MTVRRKPETDEWELKNNWTTRGFRIALLILVASMHPVGRDILHGLGFNIPRDPGVVSLEITKQLEEVKATQGAGRKVQEEVKEELARTNRNLGERLDKTDLAVKELSSKFSMFEVDFSKYRKEPK